MRLDFLLAFFSCMLHKYVRRESITLPTPPDLISGSSEPLQFRGAVRGRQDDEAGEAAGGVRCGPSVLRRPRRLACSPFPPPPPAGRTGQSRWIFQLRV